MPSKGFTVSLFFLSAVSAFIYFHIQDTREAIQQQLRRVKNKDRVSTQVTTSKSSPRQSAVNKPIQPKNETADRLIKTTEQKPSHLALKNGDSTLTEKIDFISVLHQYCALGENLACDVLEQEESSLHYKFYQCRVYGTHCVDISSQLDQTGDQENSILALKADCQINDSSDSCLQTSRRMLASEFPLQEIQEVLTIACDSEDATACLNLADLYLEMGHQRLYDQHQKKACEIDFATVDCSQFK